MAAVLFSTLIINCFVFSLIFWLLTFVAKLFYSNKYSNHKYNFYECGFKHNSKATPAYEVNYLLIVLFVLIYDGEFLILLPLALNRDLINTWTFFAVTTTFIIWLLIALLYDFSYKALEWQVMFSFTINQSPLAVTLKKKKPLTQILGFFIQTCYLHAFTAPYINPYLLTKRELRKFVMADVPLLYTLLATTLWTPLLFVWAFFIKLPQLFSKISVTPYTKAPLIKQNLILYATHIRGVILLTIITFITTKIPLCTVLDRFVLFVAVGLCLLSLLINFYYHKNEDLLLWSTLCLFLSAGVVLLILAGDLIVYFLIVELFNILYMYCFLSQLSQDVNLVKLKNTILLYIISGFLTTIFFFISLLTLLKATGTTNFTELVITLKLASPLTIFFMLFSLTIKIGAPGIYFFKLEIYKLLNARAAVIFSIITFICNTLLLYFFLVNIFYLSKNFEPALILFFLVINIICMVGGFRLTNFGSFLGFSALTTWSFIFMCFLFLC